MKKWIVRLFIAAVYIYLFLLPAAICRADDTWSATSGFWNRTLENWVLSGAAAEDYGYLSISNMLTGVFYGEFTNDTIVADNSYYAWTNSPGNTGAVINGVSWLPATNGVANHRSFNASDSEYVDLGSGRLSDATEGYYSAWIKVEALGAGNMGIICYGGDNVATAGLHYLVVRNTGSFGITQRSEDGSFDIFNSDSTLDLGVWTHVGLSSDGSVWTLYMNGQTNAGTVVSGSNSGNWLGDTTLTGGQTFIGCVRYDGSLSSYFDGEICRMMVNDAAPTVADMSNTFWETCWSNPSNIPTTTSDPIPGGFGYNEELYMTRNNRSNLKAYYSLYEEFAAGERVADQGPSSLWATNDAGGAAGTHNGTLSNGWVEITEGDGVRLPNTALNDVKTISTWVRWDATNANTYSVMLGRSKSGPSAYNVILTTLWGTGRLSYHLSNNAGDSKAATTTNWTIDSSDTGVWHHVVATTDATRGMELWLNAELVATNVTVRYPQNVSDREVRIGSWGYGVASRYLEGKENSVGLWTESWDGTDITNSFNNGATDHGRAKL